MRNAMTPLSPLTTALQLELAVRVDRSASSDIRTMQEAQICTSDSTLSEYDMLGINIKLSMN